MKTVEAIQEAYPGYTIPELPFQPVFSSIVVWRIPTQEKTAGGLYVPDTAKEPRSRGILLAAGLKALDELVDHGVELGDVVVFAKYAGSDTSVKENEGARPDEIVILKSGDVLASEGLRKRLRNNGDGVATVRIESFDGDHFLVPNQDMVVKPTKRADPQVRR